MADNITLNTGSGGAVLAADDISSVWYQRVKVCHGGDGTATDASTTNPLPVGGAADHDAAIAGYPLRVGATAINATQTAVATGDTCNLTSDLNGKLIVLPYSIPQNLISGQTAGITGTSDTEVIAAGASGVRNYVTTIVVTNAHATVSTVVNIKDGSTTKLSGFAKADGGGFTVNLASPIQGTAATAINAACVTTGSNVLVFCSGYRSP